MAPKFEFWLSGEDYDRLYALKEESGKAHLTGNEYAKILLENTLHKMHPERVEFDDETGERIKRK